MQVPLLDSRERFIDTMLALEVTVGDNINTKESFLSLK